jgi:hypothetical protein
VGHPAVAVAQGAPRAEREGAADDIGGCGFWTGFGQVIIGSKFTNSPWYSAFDAVQITFMASTRSRASLWRLAKTVPWLAISSSFQPLPIPNRKRPPETWSIEATCLAVWIGSR